MQYKLWTLQSCKQWENKEHPLKNVCKQGNEWQMILILQKTVVSKEKNKPALIMFIFFPKKR